MAGGSLAPECKSGLGDRKVVEVDAVVIVVRIETRSVGADGGASGVVVRQYERSIDGELNLAAIDGQLDGGPGGIVHGNGGAVIITGQLGAGTADAFP